MGKRLVYLLFLISCLFVSCSPPCYQWKFAAIKADCPPATYVKGYLPACNTFSGIEAQLVCTNGTFVLYLDTCTLQFPSTSDCPTQTKVNISVNNHKYQILAERLEGGQRLILPDDTVQFIIYSLLQASCVEISVGRYQTTLVCEGFSKTYNQLVDASFGK
ncbi:MAG: hypothetical protein WCF65_04695 [Parachlamydiaceae bacterium]